MYLISSKEVHRAAKEIPSLVSHLVLNTGVLYPSTWGYPDYSFSVKIHLASSKVSLNFFKSLEVHNNYTPRTTKGLKFATLSRTDKYKRKSEQKMIIFGFCETFIHSNSIAT
jgi:hypothetical protein